MKNYILTLIIFIALAGCQKVENVSGNGQVKLKTSPGQEWGIHRVYYPNLERCDKPAINCFDDIIVTPEQKNYTVFENYVDLGAEGVKEYFLHNHWQELFPNLDKETLAKLQSGKYYCRYLQKGNTKYYFFGQENLLAQGKYEYVFPFIVE